jgi:hypothetical protein
MALIVIAVEALNALDVPSEIDVEDPVVASGVVVDDASAEWEQPAEDLI